MLLGRQDPTISGRVDREPSDGRRLVTVPDTALAAIAAVSAMLAIYRNIPGVPARHRSQPPRNDRRLTGIKVRGRFLC